MNHILNGFTSAFELLLSFDPYIYGIILLTLKVSFSAIIISSLIGLPMGLWLSISKFPGRLMVITLFNTLLGLPTVIIGLVLYSLFSRSGPLGFLNLLFTPEAILIGQIILALPILIALTISTSEKLDYRIIETAKSLGASKFQTMRLLFREGKIAFITVMMTAFGRVLTELGSAIMVGGNIKGYTRTMATTITLETSKGEIGKSIALGIILLLASLLINLIINLIYLRQQLFYGKKRVDPV